MAEPDVETLLVGARAGRVRDLARLLSLVEADAPAVRDLLAGLGPLPDGPGAGPAVVVGITGAPGVGKSTTTAALVGALRAGGRRVAVLAVDPSSPFSGGALLGDRVRMAEHSTDPGVFIRSMAARGHLGGLAATTPKAIALLEAVGFDVVLVETVAVGQSEVEIASAADTTVVVLAPGMGDSIQAAKAGVLEVADILVVNKSDLPGAAATTRDLRAAVAMRAPAGRGPAQWLPPIVRLVAASGEAVADLVTAIDQHQEWLRSSGALAARRRQRVVEEIRAECVAKVLAALSPEVLDRAAQQVVGGRIDARTAAARLVADMAVGPRD